MTRWPSICAIALAALSCTLLAAQKNVTNSSLPDLSTEGQEVLMRQNKRSNFLLEKERMMKVFERSRKCSMMMESNYICNRECHISVFPESSAPICVAIEPETPVENYRRCFDQPIAYNHTVNEAALAQLDQFRVLQRFPRCWSKIAPLICAVTFRPCQRAQTYRAMNYGSNNVEANNITTNNSSKNNEIRVLYQIFTQGFCSDAIRECGFAVELGLWPNFIDCAQRVDSKHIARDVPMNDTSAVFPKLFREKCKTRYTGLNSSFRSKCAWPLVSVDEDRLNFAMRPVIDNCYLPCRSSLFESEDVYHTSRWVISVISFLLATVFIFIGLYFWLFSQAYMERYEIFLLTQAFLCVIVYYLTWAILSIDWMADASVCTAGGVARLEMTRIRHKSESGFSNFHSFRNLFSLCAVEAAVFLCTPLCAFAWLNAFLVYRCSASHFRCADFAVWFSDSTKSSSNLQTAARNDRVSLPRSCVTVRARRFLIMGIYSIGIALALLTIVAFEVPVDGIMRVCHFGARNYESSHNLYLVYVPLLLMNLAFTAIIIMRYFSRRKATANKNGDSAMAANSLIAVSGGASEQSSSSENPLLTCSDRKSAKKFGDERWKHLCLTLYYSLVYFNDDPKHKSERDVLDEDDNMNSESVISDRFVLLIFLSNLIFCCVSLYSLLNTSEYMEYDERNSIFDSISCSLRSQVNSHGLLSRSNLTNWPTYFFAILILISHCSNFISAYCSSGTAAGCEMRRLNSAQTFQMSVLTLIVPALPFLVILCCIVRSLLCGKTREARFLRVIRNRLFSCSSTESTSMCSTTSSSKISLKGFSMTCSTSGLLNAEKCSKKYEKVSMDNINREESPSVSGSQRSSIPNSGSSNDLSAQLRLFLEQQLLLQQQIQQQQQMQSPPIFDNSSSVYIPQNAIPPQQPMWPSPGLSGVPFIPPSTPMSVSASGCASPQLPLQYYDPRTGSIINQGMAPPVYTLPQQPYYLTTVVPPSPSTHYSLWNPYNRYLSASTGDMDGNVDSYPVSNSETQDDAQPEVASSLANSDPIHKSGERKIDLNRNYRTHVIQKLIHEKYQKQVEQQQKQQRPVQQSPIPNFLDEIGSIRSGMSSATLNMTSVSQQPTPAIHPVVVNALYECYKQGVEYGEQQMKDRMEEMTNLVQRYSEQLKQLFGDNYHPSVLQKLVDILTQMGHGPSSMTSSEVKVPQNGSIECVAGAAESPEHVEAKIPMIFGADGQRIMREYHERNRANFASVSCPSYFPVERNSCERKAQTVDGEFVSNMPNYETTEPSDDIEDNEISSVCEGDGENDTTSGEDDMSDFYASDEMEDVSDDTEEGDEKSLTKSRLSDDFNSDVSDPEEEKLYNIQVEKLRKLKLPQDVVESTMLREQVEHL